MAISRAQMGAQLQRNSRMKKKPVTRKVLGGMMLDKMTDGAIKAPIGIIPQLMRAQRRKDKAAAAATATKAPEPAAAASSGTAPMARPELPSRGMRKGGKVRGDGVCQRGKTKGAMR